VGAAAAELHPQKITSPWRQHGSVSTRSPILRFWTNLGVNQVHHHRALTRWTWVAGRQDASPVTDVDVVTWASKNLGYACFSWVVHLFWRMGGENTMVFIICATKQACLPSLFALSSSYSFLTMPCSDTSQRGISNAACSIYYLCLGASIGNTHAISKRASCLHIDDAKIHPYKACGSCT